MKYVIRKVPERDTRYLERLIPNAMIVNDVNHRGALWSFSEALKQANDDAIYIQDDMILCRDFVNKSATVVKDHPSEIIVFANFTHDKKTKVFKSGFYASDRVGCLLCTYIPKRIADLFLKHSEDGTWKLTDKMIRGQFDDINFNNWLRFIGQDMYLQVPNLAGHPANVSSIVKSRPSRLCWNFDYEDCEIAPDMERTLSFYRKHKAEYEAMKG